MYYNGGALPVQPTYDDQAFKRHNTARYYVHRVRESLAARISRMICAMFLFVLFVVGLIAFIVWLSLRPHRPRFYVTDFQIPVLAQGGGFENAQIMFNVTIRNSNRKIALHYESIQDAVYYQEQKIGGDVLAAEEFEQDAKNTTSLQGVLSGATLTVSGQQWTDIMKDHAAGNVQFRLEITSVIKFQVLPWWHTKKHKMYANCAVAVGQDGLILESYRNNRCPVYFT
ncbi:hypothetical protein Ancab_033575 [Ancistrocladus abbreviatus]